MYSVVTGTPSSHASMVRANGSSEPDSSGSCTRMSNAAVDLPGTAVLSSSSVRSSMPISAYGCDTGRNWYAKSRGVRPAGDYARVTPNPTP